MLGGKKMRSKTIKKVIASAVVAAMAITSIVPAAPAQAAVKAKKLTVKTKKITLYKGAAAGYGSMKLKVTVKPKKAKVTYKINKKKIATVSKKGVVKAKKPGKAKITVKSGSKKVVVKVVVKKIKKKVTKVTAPKNVTVKVGAKQKIKTSVKPKKATLKKLTFKSSAKKIAKVNAKGVITGVKAGKAKITVKAVDGSKKKATVSVVVTGAAVTSSPAVAATTPAVSKKPATTTTAPTKAPATTEPTKAPATDVPATTEPTKAPATDAPATTEPAQTATTPAVVVPTTEGGVAKYVIPALGENESYKVSFGGETVAVTDKTVAVFNETVKRFTSSSKDAAKAAASFKAKAYAGVTVAGAKITKDANAEKATVELDGQTYSLDVKADGEAAKVVVENGNTKMTADIAGSNNAYTVSNLTYGNVKVEGTKTATTEVAEDGTVTATIGSCKIVVKADGSATLDIPEAVMTKYDFKIAK
jgi:hypothetical protein